MIRAIYLEDTLSEFERFSPILERVLSARADGCKIELAKNRTEFEAALKHRPHVVFCDLDLGEGQLKKEGAQIIAQLKDKYPDVLFLLLTGQRVTMDILGSYTPNPDHILSKEYVGTREYDEYLTKFFERNLKRFPVSEVVCNFDLKAHAPRSGARVRFDKPELISLIEQCLYGVDSGVDGAETTKVDLDVVPDGLSGSGVYLMHIWTGERKNSVPAILKISEYSRAIEELTNYNRYVKWRLPYLWRVDVLGFGSCGSFGAICYSFAMAGGKEPATINKYLRMGESRAVDAVVRSILFSENQNWYAERRESGKDARIYLSERPYYNNNRRREQREQFFKDMLTEVASKGGHKILFGEDQFWFADREYSNVNRCLFGRDWGAIRTCVCHGDMNGSNIMYTGDREEVAFIDFQNTGFHYLFKDFISFESSVRLEFPGDDQRWNETEFTKLINEEDRLIAAGFNLIPNDRTYIRQVSKIRDAAHSNFDEKFSIYVLANTVHSLWLLEKSQKWAPYKQRRLLASILAGLSFLQAGAHNHTATM